MDDRQMVNMRAFSAALRGAAGQPMLAASRIIDGDEVPFYETKGERFQRAERDGERFERCRFGRSVATCYHEPRCTHETPGFGRYVPGPDDTEPRRQS